MECFLFFCNIYSSKNKKLSKPLLYH